MLAVGFNALSLAYMNDFLAAKDGRALARSFMQIKSTKLRRIIMVEQIAGSRHLLIPGEGSCKKSRTWLHIRATSWRL